MLLESTDAKVRVVDTAEIDVDCDGAIEALHYYCRGLHVEIVTEQVP